MELNHLKYFHTVAKEGSFTRASQRLRIQQPTISKMVRALEDQLGLLLMERRKDGIRLTESGLEIFRLCEAIFDQVSAIESFSSVEKAECSGPLSFGATDSVASYLLPGIIASYLRQYPAVLPSLFAGSSNLVCNEILEGRVEFGIFFTIPDRAGFQITELTSIPFDLCIATSVAKDPEVRKSFIISRDIDYSKTKPFPVLEMLKKNRVRVETAIACNNLDAQKEMVKQGLGVALLPRFMVKSSLSSGSLTAVETKKSFAYSLKIVTRKGKVLSRNAKTFLEVFEAKLAKLL